MPNETNETLSPEQFFEQHHFAGEYLRKEDFLKYCEQQLEVKVQILNEIAKINEARTVLIILDCLNECMNRRGKERLPRGAFLEVSKNIYKTLKNS